MAITLLLAFKMCVTRNKNTIFVFEMKLYVSSTCSVTVPAVTVTSDGGAICGIIFYYRADCY